MARRDREAAPRAGGTRKVGFHKGSLGSPFQLEYQGDEGLEPGDADYQSGPRVGSGVLGRRVMMEVQRAGTKNFGRGSSDAED